MSPTTVELYEALEPTVGEDAARMIAEIFPAAANLATKADIQLGFAKVWEEFAQIRGEMREGFAQGRAEANADRVSMLKWLIALMVPMWIGSWGTVAAVMLKG